MSSSWSGYCEAIKLCAIALKFKCHLLLKRYRIKKEKKTERNERKVPVF